MSDWLKLYKSAKPTAARGGEAAADYSEYPLLSSAMAGVRRSDGKGWETPPMSLTIWLEGSLAKFCLGCKDGRVKVFGTFSGLDRGLAGVEASMKNGQCEVREFDEQGKSRRQ
jgi:hypothetical protein